MDTTTKKTIPKVPEILLKKRKLYADLKAKRLRGQVQANKVMIIDLQRFSSIISVCFL